MVENDKDWRRLASLQKIKRERRKRMVLIAATLIVIVAVFGVCIKYIISERSNGKESNSNNNVQISNNDPGNVGESQPGGEIQPADLRFTTMEKAKRVASGYDYDKAIEMVRGLVEYDTDAELQALVSEFEVTKSTMVRFDDVTNVTHIFFHSNIYDTNKAFNSSTAGGYNSVMTTCDEFGKIMQSMYDRGFVLISIHDMFKEVQDENGNTVYKAGDIMLPAGKKPFVLSQDDVSFYHYMTGAGFADRIVIGADGKPTCEMDLGDGTTVQGDFDMVPQLETFIEAHPDFSYRGARGILALTGYNGVLGYRTDSNYKPNSGTNDKEVLKFLEENPDFNWDAEVEKAKAVAQCLTDNGWEFGSHTWGHILCGQSSIETIKTDTQRWLDNVAPIVGNTDILIFPHGEDIGSWTDYTADNAKFNYFKSVGFNIFCNVDSAEYWVQLRSNYMRQGRRNIDGFRMWQAIESGSAINLLSDLFDVNQVFDPARPKPVAH